MTGISRPSWGTNKLKQKLVEWMSELSSIASSSCPCIVYLTSLRLSCFICTMRILVTHVWIRGYKMSDTAAAQSRLSWNCNSLDEGYYGLGSLCRNPFSPCELTGRVFSSNWWCHLKKKKAQCQAHSRCLTNVWWINQLQIENSKILTFKKSTVCIVYDVKNWIQIRCQSIGE